MTGPPPKSLTTKDTKFHEGNSSASCPVDDLVLTALRQLIVKLMAEDVSARVPPPPYGPPPATAGLVTVT